MLRTGLLIALLAASAAAQELPFQTDEAALAAQALAVYQDTNRETFLDNRFRLELLAGRSREALKIIAELRSLRAGKTPAARAINVQYEILARAGQHRSKGSFARAFRGADLAHPIEIRVVELPGQVLPCDAIAETHVLAPEERGRGKIETRCNSSWRNK